MAKTDIVLINSIVDERCSSPNPSAQERGEVFERFATEQILKESDLSDEEISAGIVDGKDDGGIDSFYIFVNGNLLQDDHDFMWPKSSCEITVYIITCKHYDTFRQDVINNEYATISEVLDLSLPDSQIKGNYNADVLEQRKLLMAAYKKTAARLTNLSIKFFFASRGDTTAIGENIVSRSEQIEDKVRELFSNCQVTYEFVGSTELLAYYRKMPQYDLDLPYVTQMEYQGGHIILARLSDYYRFITDEDGNLRKYLFDSNVRDFMGMNAVNSDIMNTLNNPGKTDFWWLNNGITILATSAVSTNNILTIQNVQIVNGLQTSQTIYRHFSSKEEKVEDNRLVMIKLIKQDDDQVRDDVIRSTNNQTSIAVTSLFATDDVQRNIEDIMKNRGLYYERRVNYYVNQGIDRELIFDIMYLTAGYIALVLKAPYYASRLKRKVLTDPTRYNMIFDSGTSLEIWPQMARLLRMVDKELLILLNKAADFSYSNNRLKKSRYIVTILILARKLGTFNFTAADIVRFDTSSVSKGFIKETWDFVSKYFANEYMTKRWYLNHIYEDASVHWGITNGLEAILRQDSVFDTEKLKPLAGNRYIKTLAGRIQEVLPERPWNQSLSKSIALTLNVKSAAVNSAIRLMVEEGLFSLENGVQRDEPNTLF